MCVIRRTIAYLFLNMINFDAVDFSERRSEEVMFLLTLSVCKRVENMTFYGLKKQKNLASSLHSLA